MFFWFKKKLQEASCQHYKRSGEKSLTNMVEVLRFSPYAKDSIGYGISECSECGKRAFSCIGLHIMGPKMCSVIDSFIAYEMTFEQLHGYLSEHCKWVEINHTQEK